MGNVWVREFHEGKDVTPRQDSKPTFDPLLGFPQGRKPRVMTVTAEVREETRPAFGFGSGRIRTQLTCIRIHTKIRILIQLLQFDDKILMRTIHNRNL